MTTLKKRKVGKTNIEVTELGLGGAPMGGFRATISDTDATAQAAHGGLVEHVTHQAVALVQAQTRAIHGGNAGGVLATVLQHGQTVIK